MSLLTKVEHVEQSIVSLFGSHADLAHVVLKDVSGLLTFAQPIVRAVEKELKTLATVKPSERVAQIEKFLAGYSIDLLKNSARIHELATLPAADLYKGAAVLALTKWAPANAETSLLNLAIEWAYSIFKVMRRSPSA
jgi:hypothetical protein